VGFGLTRRSQEQNNLLWSRLSDVATQVEWSVDGKMQFLSPTDWKDILTAGLTKTTRVAAGVDGGFVILGARTSRMTIGQMQELLDFISWFGDSRDPPVQWTINTDA
jgi:hypothetical protein